MPASSPYTRTPGRLLMKATITFLYETDPRLFTDPSPATCAKEAAATFSGDTEGLLEVLASLPYTVSVQPTETFD